MTESKKRSKVPWIVLVLGVLLLAGGCGLSISGVVSGVQSVRTWATPGAVTEELAAGDWTVFEQVPLLPGSTSSGGRKVSTEHELTADDIHVVGPEGPIQVVCVSCGTFTETVTLGSDGYLGIARFSAPTSGSYTISTEAAGGNAMLAPPVGQTVGRAFGWIGVAVLGGFVIIAAVIWLIIQAVGGRRVVPARPRGAAWYPDPGGSGQLRWWNGTRWTDDTHPPA